jgi:hypothetical protein
MKTSRPTVLGLVLAAAVASTACSGGSLGPSAPRPTGGRSGDSTGGGSGAAGVSGTGGAGGNTGSAGGASGTGPARPDAGSGGGASDARPRADASAPGPAVGETYAPGTSLSPGTGQLTDRRPIPIGFYDATANKTFVSWMGPGSDALVKEYNHVTGTWSPDKVAGNATFVDKHNYPALIKGQDNRLYIFYGCHNSPLRMTVSPNPLSIDGTWRDGVVTAAPDASYPAPIITSDGTIYVFIRLTRMMNGAEDDRPFAFVKSTNSGQSWTTQTVIDNYPRTDNLTEIYNGKISYEPAHGAQKAKIHLAWTLAGGGPGQHLHDAFTRNIYYAYLDPTNDHLYSIKGKDLGTSIDDTEGEVDTRVLDTGCSNCAHQTGYQISAHYNDDGTPLIMFGHYMNGLTAIRWDGTTWQQKVVATANAEPRDINKIGPQSFQAFRSSGSTCVVYRTTDGGANWAQETIIRAPHPVARCHVIQNGSADVKVFMEESPDVSGGGTSTASVTAGFAPSYQPAAGP